MSGLDQYGQYEDEDPGMRIKHAVLYVILLKCKVLVKKYAVYVLHFITLCYVFD